MSAAKLALVKRLDALPPVEFRSEAGRARAAELADQISDVEELIEWCACQARALRAVGAVLDMHRGDLSPGVAADLNAALAVTA